MAVLAVKIDEIRHEQPLVPAMGQKLFRQLGHVFRVVGCMVRLGQADMGVNIADFPYADDAEARFLQVFKDHFPLRQAAVVAAVASADEMALLADEGPGNDTPHFVGADADFAARNVADTVQLFQRNDVVMSGNLEHAVCRRVDDGLLRAKMIRPEAFDDFRARSDFVANIAVPRLGRE